ncbi:uncharacterized protein MELLADRAFT_59215 [Melampsora larici-populina 98AG31]|uniref:Uncharacterized protein n=1 Tax=Melampsora larici-populina (strain 98AG31 / pathotype 3-4-7) TaxID=747676 RepID=F4R5G9_MELLP|nr:uncharacterized protein MELLADRAFT_59215 [Melampsora larici-populina 98AG31]EGG12262.1 hypothetical protein MELLADRAFT_59215 [Melampsora larici-populina 98AG31]
MCIVFVGQNSYKIGVVQMANKGWEAWSAAILPQAISWHELAKGVRGSEKGQIAVQLIKLLGLNLNMLKLEFTSSTGSSPAVVEAVKALKNLKTLHLAWRGIRRVARHGERIYHSNFLTDLLNATPQLECLSLHGHVDLDGLQLKPDTLSRLRKLSFTSCAGPDTIDALALICQAAQHNLKVIELDGGHKQLTDAIVEPIKANLEACFTFVFTNQIPTSVLRTEFPKLRRRSYPTSFHLHSTMVVATLIHSDYVFVTPGYLPEPPAPGSRKGQPVGIYCPICNAGLKYWTPKSDAWFIGCPNSQQHNTRTWRCDQFNHERTLINLGFPRPIISTFKDWGPRISPAGHILDPLPPQVSPTRHFMPFLGDLLNPTPLNHPFQGRELQGPVFSNPMAWSPPGHLPTASSSASQPASMTNETPGLTPGPHLSAPPVPCKRTTEGPVPKGHRKHANKKCRFLYCQACCNAHGQGVCRAHPRNVKANTPFSPYGRSMPTSTPTPNNTPLSGEINPRRSWVTEPRCHQWAQSANSLGRRLHVDSVITLHKNRLEKYQPEIQKKYNETKMVTVYLWVNVSISNQPYLVVGTQSSAD